MNISTYYKKLYIEILMYITENMSNIEHLDKSI